ncbi:MAG: DNA-binding protein [Acidobacteria bacterium]|nr:DNA-binding protein [Acidobacteriota bacterium]
MLMRYAKLGDGFLVRLATGEEIVGAITEFAHAHSIDAASVSAIGSAYDVVLGYFDRATRSYERHAVPGEVEISSLLGNIALKEGRAFPHLHVTVGGRDFRALAGHLFEGKAGATCEVIFRPMPGCVQRVKDEATGLFLLDL